MGLELHNHSKRNQATKPVTQSCLQWPSVTKNTQGNNERLLKDGEGENNKHTVSGPTYFDTRNIMYSLKKAHNFVVFGTNIAGLPWSLL